MKLKGRRIFRIAALLLVVALLALTLRNQEHLFSLPDWEDAEVDCGPLKSLWFRNPESDARRALEAEDYRLYAVSGIGFGVPGPYRVPWSFYDLEGDIRLGELPYFIHIRCTTDWPQSIRHAFLNDNAWDFAYRYNAVVEETYWINQPDFRQANSSAESTE